MEKLLSRKVVFIGDDTCGNKSPGVFPPENVPFGKEKHDMRIVPSAYEVFYSTVFADDTPVELEIWDTVGREEYDRLRTLVYPKAHVICLCYAVDNPNSLEQLQERWLPEARLRCPNVPLLLVGLKKDLRKNPGFGENDQRVVSVDQAVLVAQEIKAYKHWECSAKSGEGVAELFEYAAQAALTYKPTKLWKCCTVL